MTAATSRRAKPRPVKRPAGKRSAHPRPVPELADQVRSWAGELGRMPSQREIRDRYRIGHPKAREVLDEAIRNRLRLVDATAPEAVPEPVVETGLEAVLESVTETTPKTAPETTPEVASEPTPGTDVEPVVEPAPEPLPEPVLEPLSEPVPEPAEPLVSGRTGPPFATTPTVVPEPTPEPHPEPVIEPLPEPVSGAVSEPLSEPASGPVTEPSGSRVRAWPLLLLVLPAMVAIWAGWVGLGKLTGFGPVDLLPGFTGHKGQPLLTVNTAITLPVGMETYAAFALRVWLSGQVPARARRFARWSVIWALGVGAAGQVVYHLLTAAHAAKAPWPITMLVACLPVAVLGMGAALAHLLRNKD